MRLCVCVFCIDVFTSCFFFLSVPFTFLLFFNSFPLELISCP